MKNVKLWIICAVLIIAQTSFAQKRGGHGEHRANKIEKMKAELDLTDTQVEQLEKIRAEFKTKMVALKEEGSDREEMREAFHQLKDEHRTAIEGVLTNEQLAKMEAHRAEKKEHRAEIREKFKSIDKTAFKEEMRAYKKENVHPVILAQRKKMEASISQADKRDIEELRQVFKAAKKERKEKMAPFKENGERPTREQMEAFKAEYERKYKTHFEKAQALTEKYATQIDALLAEVADEKETWKSDVKDIKNEHFGEIMEEMKGKKDCDKETDCKGKRGHGRKGHAMKHGRKGKDHRVRFLMMDVDEEKRTADKPRINKGKQGAPMKVYPNPSTTTNTLEYTVEKAGMVKVELHDKQGNVIQQVSSEYKQAGTYTETVNLSMLKGIVYFYVITDESGVRSQKFMVRK